MSFETDSRFERALLESGRADPRPRGEDTARAWDRLASSIGLALAEPDLRDAGASGPARPPELAPARANIPSAGARVLPFGSGALKLLLIGALGGSALTAGWRFARRADPTATTASATTHARTTAASPSATTRTQGAAPMEVSPPAVAPEPRAADDTPVRHVPPDPPPRPAARLSRAIALGSPRSTGRGAESPPELAAEVGRLDAARAASARGDYDEALAIVERYHRDFPRGRLGPDADVVAIEAAAASGDAAATANRVALFLARHPDDPHAARVRRLGTASDAGPPPR